MNPGLEALQLVILLFSVIAHEVMHGFVALKFGDRTAEQAGRLTFNPIPHIDPIGTILVPGLLILSGSGVLFGWAKPVPVNPLNFNNLRKGELFVSAAGIVTNFTLAMTAALLFHIFNTIPSFPPIILSGLIYMVFINLLLAIFNVIPIPPLDGSKILQSQLSYNIARTYESVERYGPILLLILLFSGLLWPIFNFFIKAFWAILQLPPINI